MPRMTFVRMTDSRKIIVSVIVLFTMFAVVYADSRLSAAVGVKYVPINSGTVMGNDILQQRSAIDRSHRKRVNVRISNEIDLTWDNTTFKFVHDKKYSAALKLLKEAPVRYIDSMNGSRMTNAWHCEVEGYLSQGELAFILYVQCFNPPMMDLFKTQMDAARCQFGGAEWLRYFRLYRPKVIRKLTDYLSTASGVQRTR